jgi:transcription initiation factor IIE alpha subunit
MPYEGYNYTKPEWLELYEFWEPKICEEVGMKKEQINKVIEALKEHKILPE